MGCDSCSANEVTVLRINAELQNKERELSVLSERFKVHKLQSKGKIAQLKHQLEAVSSDAVEGSAESKLSVIVGKLEETEACLEQREMDASSLRQQLSISQSQISDHLIRIKSLEQQVESLQSTANSLVSMETNVKDPKPTSLNNSADVQKMYAQLVYKDSRMLELNSVILERDRQIVDLQELYREKEEVLSAKTRAIHILNQQLQIASYRPETRDIYCETNRLMEEPVLPAPSVRSPGRAVPLLFPRTGSPPPADPAGLELYDDLSSITTDNAQNENLPWTDNGSEAPIPRKKAKKRVTFDLGRDQKISELEEKLRDQEMTTEELKLENDELRTSLSELENCMDHVSRQNKDHALQAKLLQAQTDQLQSDLDQCKKDKKAVGLKAKAQSQSRLRELEEEVERLLGELEECKDKLYEAHEGEKQAISDNQHLQQTIQKYRIDCHELQDKLESLDVDCRALNEGLRNKDRHVKKLQEKLSASEEAFLTAREAEQVWASSEQHTSDALRLQTQLGSQLQYDLAIITAENNARIEEQRELRDQLFEAQSTADKLLEQKKQVLTDLDSLKEAMETSQQVIDYLQDELDNVTQQLAELRCSKGEITKELMRESASHKLKGKALWTKLIQEQAQKTELQTRLAEITKQLNLKSKAFDAKIKSIENEKGLINDQLMLTRSRILELENKGTNSTESSPRKDSMEIEIKMLKKRLEDQSNEFTSLKSANRNLLDEKSEIEHELEELWSRETELKRVAGETDSINQRLREERDKLWKQSQQLQSSEDRLSEQISQLTCRKRELKMEVSKMEDRVVLLENSATNETKDLADEMQKFKEFYQNVIDEKERLSKAMDLAVKQIETLREEKKVLQDDNFAALSKLEETENVLQNEIRELNANLNSYRSCSEELQKQVNKDQDQIFQLRNKLQESVKDRQSLNAVQKEKLMQSVLHFRTQLDSICESHLHLKKEFLSQCGSVKTIIMDKLGIFYEHKMREFDEMLSERDESIGSLDCQVGLLRKEKDSALDELRETLTSRAKLEEHNESLQSDISRLRVELESLEVNQNDVVFDLDAARVNAEANESKLNEAAVHLKNVQGKLSSCEEQLICKCNVVDELQIERNSLLMQLSAKLTIDTPLNSPEPTQSHASPNINDDSDYEISIGPLSNNNGQSDQQGSFDSTEGDNVEMHADPNLEKADHSVHDLNHMKKNVLVSLCFNVESKNEKLNEELAKLTRDREALCAEIVELNERLAELETDNNCLHLQISSQIENPEIVDENGRKELGDMNASSVSQYLQTISSLESEVQLLRHCLNEAQTDLLIVSEERDELSVNIEELKNNSDIQENSMRQINSNMDQLKAKKECAENELKDLLEKGKEREQDYELNLQKRRHEFQEMYQNYTNVCQLYTSLQEAYTNYYNEVNSSVKKVDDQNIQTETADVRTETCDAAVHVATETVDVATETVDFGIETVDVFTETVDFSAQPAEAINATVEAATETVDIVSEAVEAATETVDIVSETVEASTETVDIVSETVEAATETVEAATETVDIATETVEAATETVAIGTETVGFTTGTVGFTTGTVDVATETVGGAIETSDFASETCNFAAETDVATEIVATDTKSVDSPLKLNATMTETADAATETDEFGETRADKRDVLKWKAKAKKLEKDFQCAQTRYKNEGKALIDKMQAVKDDFHSLRGSVIQLKSTPVPELSQNQVELFQSYAKSALDIKTPSLLGFTDMKFMEKILVKIWSVKEEHNNLVLEMNQMKEFWKIETVRIMHTIIKYHQIKQERLLEAMLANMQDKKLTQFYREQSESLQQDLELALEQLTASKMAWRKLEEEKQKVIESRDQTIGNLEEEIDSMSSELVELKTSGNLTTADAVKQDKLDMHAIQTNCTSNHDPLQNEDFNKSCNFMDEDYTNGSENTFITPCLITPLDNLFKSNLIMVLEKLINLINKRKPSGDNPNYKEEIYNFTTIGEFNGLFSSILLDLNAEFSDQNNESQDNKKQSGFDLKHLEETDSHLHNQLDSSISTLKLVKSLESKVIALENNCDSIRQERNELEMKIAMLELQYHTAKDNKVEMNELVKKLDEELQVSKQKLALKDEEKSVVVHSEVMKLNELIIVKNENINQVQLKLECLNEECSLLKQSIIQKDAQLISLNDIIANLEPGFKKCSAVEIELAASELSLQTFKSEQEKSMCDKDLVLQEMSSKCQNLEQELSISRKQLVDLQVALEGKTKYILSLDQQRLSLLNDHEKEVKRLNSEVEAALFVQNSMHTKLAEISLQHSELLQKSSSDVDLNTIIQKQMNEIENCQKRYADLNEEKTNINLECERLHNLVSEKDGVIDSLQDCLKTQMKDIDGLQNLKQTNSCIVANYESRLNNLEAELEAAVFSRNSINVKFDEICEKNSQLIQKASTDSNLNVTLQKQADQIEILQIKLSGLNDEKLKIMVDYYNLQNHSTDMEQLVATLQEALQNQREEIISQEKVIAENDKNLSEANARFELMNKECEILSSLKEENCALKTELEQFVFTQTSTQLEEINVEHSHLSQNDCTDNGLNAIIQKQASEIEICQKRYASLNDEKCKIMLESERLNCIVSEKEKNIESLKISLQSLMEDMDNLRQSKEETSQILANCEGRTNDLEVELQAAVFAKHSMDIKLAEISQENSQIVQKASTNTDLEVVLKKQADQIEIFQNKLSNMNEEKAKLMTDYDDQIAIFQNKLSNMNEEKAKLITDYERLQDHANDADQLVLTLKIALQKERDEINSLEKIITEKETNFNEAYARSDLIDKKSQILNSLQDENDTLKSELGRVISGEHSLQLAENSVQMGVDHSQLIQKSAPDTNLGFIIQQQACQIDVAQKELASVKEEKTKIMVECEKLQKDELEKERLIGSLQDFLISQSEKIRELEIWKDRNSQIVTDYEETINRLKADLEAACVAKNSIDMKLAEISEENSQLIQKASTITNLNEILQKQADEIEIFRNKLSYLTQENSKITTDNDRLQNHATDMENLISTLRGDTQTQSEEIKNLKKIIRVKEKESNARLDQLDKDLQILNSLKDQNFELKTELEKSVFAQASVENKLAEVNMEHNELLMKSSIESNKLQQSSAYELQEQKEKMVELENTVVSLHATISKMEETSSKEIMEIKLLKQELASAKAAVALLEKQSKESFIEATTSKEELKSVDKERLKAVKSLATSEKRIEKLKGEVMRLKDCIAKHSETILQLEESIHISVQARDQTLQQLGQMKELITCRDRSIESLQLKVSDKDKMLCDYEESNNLRDLHLLNLEEIEKLKSEKTQFEDAIQDSRQDNEELMKRIGLLQEECAKCNQMNSEFTVRNNDLHSQIIKLQDINKELENKLESAVLLENSEDTTPLLRSSRATFSNILPVCVRDICNRGSSSTPTLLRRTFRRFPFTNMSFLLFRFLVIIYFGCIHLALAFCWWR